MFAMAGGTDNHNRIAINLIVPINAAAEAAGCNAFMNDVLVRTPDGIGYYPDVFVTCEEQNDGSRIKRKPCFVIEVLSDTTEAIDRDEKLRHYRKIPSLQAYILVSQHAKLFETFRRLPEGFGSSLDTPSDPHASNPKPGRDRAWNASREPYPRLALVRICRVSDREAVSTLAQSPLNTVQDAELYACPGRCSRDRSDLKVRVSRTPLPTRNTLVPTT